MKWLSIRNPLLLSEVIKVENDLDVVFPTDYREKIGSINGGALRNAYIRHSEIGEIPYSRNVPLNQDAKGSIYRLFNAISGTDKRYFPFGSVGNGDYFCFDLHKNKVVFFMHETDTVFEICDTFTELLQMIKEE